MPQPTKSEAIKNYLMASTHLDLATRYHLGMECQVNVAPDGGERIDGDYRGRQWHGYSDGITTWKPIRIPWNAAGEPTFEDSPMTFDLATHCEGIGMTGWNWKDRQSEWVGFDFDAIAGHSDTHKGKLTERELTIVQENACAIPWITVRRSTSGNGLHLYVHLEYPIETMNHTEHAALARAIIAMMAGKTGFDFHSKVDVCGGNMWVWHRKMKGTNGLTLIKQGEPLQAVSDNWRDHISVIKQTRPKTLPTFIENSPIPELDQLFDDLTGQRANIKLDDGHLRLMNWLTDNGRSSYWDQDRWMMVCHTADLKDAHVELELRGVFETDTRKSSQHNCFAFPWRNGAWAIRRFSPGAKEHESWSQDGAGWTQCYYNRNPDLATASKTSEGIEHKSGGYVFAHAEHAIKAAELLGVAIELPAAYLSRPTKLKENKDGRLVVEIDFDKNDHRNGGLKGWIPEGKTWSKVFNANLRQPAEVEAGNYEDVVRHIITEGGEDCGWAINTSGSWVGEPLAHVRPALQAAYGMSSKDLMAVIGGSVMKHWKLVNMPFQPEYPGDRQWNRKAAQFVYPKNENTDNLQYDVWMKVLSHSGAGLDAAIKSNGWCKQNCILNGADYLKLWIASLFQKPREPLPYLFFYSTEQNTGKSIFHEALSELVTSNAVQRADNALTNQQGFNGELANAILCVVEETDLSKSKNALNRIKDWVTSRMFPVHPKGETPYSIPNTTHWIQTANSHSYCPVLPGDTRITMIHVRPLEPHELIPKTRLLEMLRKQAPDFMAEVMKLEIPPSGDRLNVPVITTDEKIAAQATNMTRLESFLHEMTFQVDGEMIKLGDFHEAFTNWLDPAEALEWTKNKTSKEMPPQFPKGRLRKDGQFYYGNLSFEPRKPEARIKPKLIINGEFLDPVGS